MMRVDDETKSELYWQKREEYLQDKYHGTDNESVETARERDKFIPLDSGLVSLLKEMGDY